MVTCQAFPTDSINKYFPSAHCVLKAISSTLCSLHVRVKLEGHRPESPAEIKDVNHHFYIEMRLADCLVMKGYLQNAKVGDDMIFRPK